ncbi:HGxxPAAW family protein [Streptomyces sp. NPDC021562]|uniref:HGxxPAAW family protein n=1 Tax=Streptomyces sp. NPDC021562 TaxID=3155121 RepID=UPI0010E3F503
MSQHDEGHTVAGWTGTAIATVGSGLLGLAVCAASVPALVAGLAVCAVSVLVTWYLHLAGWGKPPGPRPRSQWALGVRDAGARDGHPGCVSCRLAGRGRRTASGLRPTHGAGGAEGRSGGAGSAVLAGEPEAAVAEAGG